MRKTRPVKLSHALLVGGWMSVLAACGPIPPEKLTPENVSYRGFNANTVQVVPPATPQGQACSRGCLQGLATCQNGCAEGAECAAACTLSYRACHVKCGGQVVVKPARSKQ